MRDTVTAFGIIAFILFIISSLQVTIHIHVCDGIIRVSDDTFSSIIALCESYIAGYIVYFLTVVCVEWIKALRSRPIVYDMLVELNMEVSQIIENASSRANDFSRIQLNNKTIIFASDIDKCLSNCDCKKSIAIYDGVKVAFLLAVSDFCKRCRRICNQILSFYGDFLSIEERGLLTGIVSSNIYGWLSFNEISDSVSEPCFASNNKFIDFRNMLSIYVGCLQKAVHISQSCNVYKTSYKMRLQ